MNIVFIGAGNLATHLSQALQQSGHQIVQVFSRTTASASLLAERLKVPYTINIKEVDTNADVYIYTVSDDALDLLIQSIDAPKALHIHTAGSVSTDVFQGKRSEHGVLYPLQTFSKNKQLDFKQIPLFIEASSPEAEKKLHHLAQSISDRVYQINSEQRLKLHIAAVFACNFVNHLYHIAADIVASVDLPFEVLKPLIIETAGKVLELMPVEAQTGPAKRDDKGVINKHVDVLMNDNPDLSKLYKELSDMILNQYLHQS